MSTQTLDRPQNACQSTPSSSCATHAYVPAIDVVEHDHEFVLQADIPGATAENIDLQYERGVLTLRARVAPRNSDPGRRWLLREYGVGDFHRAFQIGDGIDASRIDAQVTAGVLTLRLPKAESAKVRKIGVKTAI